MMVGDGQRSEKDEKYFEKSCGKICIIQKLFVTLQSIREMLCECGRRLSKGQASLPLHSPCTTLAL